MTPQVALPGGIGLEQDVEGIVINLMFSYTNPGHEIRVKEIAEKVMGGNGNPVVDEVGELVVTEPMPSMPIFFWNDPDGKRYRDSIEMARRLNA